MCIAPNEMCTASRDIIRQYLRLTPWCYVELRAFSFIVPVLKAPPSYRPRRTMVMVSSQDFMMVTDKAASTRERGEARKHLLINSALLSLIEPVRGEPTEYLLECHPDADVWKSSQLKEKFLDSFALICSTSSSGKETASAVCMEQKRPSGTILRIARNRGLSQQDRIGLERVLQILIAAANGGM